ncbi:MAG: DsrE family protein [Dehalococcoidia bacterium]
MTDDHDALAILWTSGDREVALKMVFMYTLNARIHKWWDDITLIVWGPSAKLLSEDKEIQASISQLKEAGVTLEACRACSDQYGVSSTLRDLGVNVKYMGIPLTEYLKSGKVVLAV